jgi:putative heme iron utilization protein
VAAKGAVLARHEGNFRGNAKEPLGLNELLSLLASVEESDVRARNDAIACALSASEGWQEAVRRLGGAFAEEMPELRERKDELPDD